MRKTYPISHRLNKVHMRDFAKVAPEDPSFRSFTKCFPNLLAAKQLFELVEHIVRARRGEKGVVLCFGAHVVKCGLSPLVLDLTKKGLITALATNGAGAIHDFEIAMIGATSEDVETSLKDGSFGMAEETGRLMNEAFIEGAMQGKGAGQTLGEKIIKEEFPHAELSLLVQSVRANIPLTVHIALGTDVIHQHPKADGSAIGQTSFRDFELFCESVRLLNDGGVILNFGSAVILPEVFLKALNLARNEGSEVRNFITADFDMIRQYRPLTNVVRRPTCSGGTGYSFIGHHEIMLPLLYQITMERWSETG